MKPKTIKRLFRSNLVAALLCLLFFFYMGVSLPSMQTEWTNREWAFEQIQSAKTIDQMTPMFQGAVSRLSSWKSSVDTWFSIVWIASFVFFAFLCTNLIQIGLLHRQIRKSNDDAD